VPPFCLFMYVAGRGGQQFFTCCPAGYIAFIWSHVTTNQPITFGVHPIYITKVIISGHQKFDVRAQKDILFLIIENNANVTMPLNVFFLLLVICYTFMNTYSYTDVRIMAPIFDSLISVSLCDISSKLFSSRLV
jgi:hypothetical protein